MRKTTNKILSALIAASLVFGMVTTASAASEGDTEPTAATVQETVETPAEDQQEPAAEETVTEEPAAEESEEQKEEAPAAAEEEKAEEQKEEAPAEEAPAEEIAPAEEAAPAEEVAPAEEEAVETVSEPEEETAAAMPAQTFSKTVKEKVKGKKKTVVKVEVSAPEGAFPEGTEMTVTKVGENDRIGGRKRGKTYRQAIEGVAKSDVKSIMAVDITFTKDGKEIEPAKDISVSFKSDSLAAKEDQTLSIVHIADDGSAEVIEDAEINEKKQEATFDAGDFSVYAVVETGSDDDNARVTVNFKNGDTILATYYVKNKDVLTEIEKIVVDPGAGTLASDELFEGWSLDELKKSNGDYYNGPFTEANPKTYVGKDYTLDTTPKTIKEIREYLESLEIHEGDVLDIYAVVYKFYSVTYYGLDPGVSLGTDIVLRLKNQTSSSYTVNMAFTTDLSNAKFMGWKAPETYDKIQDGTADTIYANKDVITITGNIVFKAYAPLGNWLVYDNNGGGTYNAPEFYIGSTPTEQAENAKPENMKRYGYTFGGWFTDKDCTQGNEYGFNEVLQGKRTIYAKWIQNEKAPYTVLIWRQKLDANGKASSEYELFASHPSEGTIGENIPYENHDDGAQDYAILENSDGTDTGIEFQYTGFCLKPEIDNVKITVDGKAVLNLYYDRIQYNVRFYVYRAPGNRTNYSYGNNSNAGQNTWGIVSYHNSNNHPDLTTAGQNKYGPLKESENIDGYTGYYFVISARYGENIAEQWPTYDDIQGADNRSPVSFVMMNGTKLKPQPSNGGDGTVKGIVSYLNENILGRTNSTEGNFLIVRYNTYNTWTYHIMLEVLPDADGHYPAGAVYLERTGKYYLESEADKVITRSSNTIPNSQNAPKFNGYDTVMLNASTAYSDGYNAEVTNQNGVSGHTPELNYYYNLQTGHISFMDGQYVDGDGNLVKNQSGNNISQSVEIAQGTNIASYNKEQENYYIPNLPAGEEGYVFEGWYFDKACTQEYTFDTMPIGGIIVYAKWRQIEYRVILHPNAGTSETNPDLYWGSNNQQMNFRVPYGDKVSTPTGIWTEGLYEFIAWFTEDGQVYDGDLFELNEETVTQEYNWDLEENYTDEMDQWGNGATYNKDKQNNRWWITKKLDLYAQWREVTPGAKGIDVYYNAVGFDIQNPNQEVTGTINGTERVYQDPLQYLDSASATATAASTPDNADDYQFLFWVVQKWDESTNQYVDVLEDGKKIEVYPGDEFTVYKKYSKVDVTEWKDKDGNTSPTQSDQYNIISKATYSMYLRAEYGPAETPKDTYFNWYRNWSSDDTAETGLLHKEEGLQINEAVDIYTLKEGIPTRPGYKFLGWARCTEKEAADSQIIPYHAGLNEDDLYIRWTGDHYEAKNSKNQWVTVTQTAADDLTPYQAFYAIWQANYYVYYSGSGKVYAYDLEDTVNLQAHSTDGTLYGGYSTAYYGGYTIKDADKEEASKKGENGYQINTTENTTAIYNPDKTYVKGLTKWWNTMGTTPYGELTPKAGDVYYVKEVPNKYLTTRIQYIYDWSQDYKINQIYMMTVVDDKLYNEVFFNLEITATSKKTATLVGSFTFEQGNSTVKVTTKPKDFAGVNRGWIGYADGGFAVTEGFIAPNTEFKITPCWTTKDGVTVTGSARRFTTGEDGNKSTIHELTE